MQNFKFFFPSRPKTSEKSRLWRRVVSFFLLPCYGLVGWLRLAGSIQLWDYFVELNLWPRPLYIALSGGIIGMCFTLAWLFLLFRVRFGWIFNRIIGIFFLLWFWVDRIWLSTRAAFFNQLVIAFFITGITVLWVTVFNPKPNQSQMEANLEPQTGTGN